MAMTVLQCDLLKQIQDCYSQDLVVSDIIEQLKKDPRAKKYFSWSQEILRRKNKIVVPASVSLRNSILDWFHCSSQGGHSGRDVTV